MFLENEHQPIISHSPYDMARPIDLHHHHHLQHHQTTINHPSAAELLHQDDSEGGRSSVSSPTSSYRDLSGCEDFDIKIPKPRSTGGSVTGGGGSGNNNNNNNKEQKSKKHKCKHCGLECTEKVQYWKHIRTHIKPEQLLECPNCEFVTDLKHHYEYHLLNHTGAKPFTCPDCDYKCVSKSMLQSHLKSHSNVFQFQCYDCGYASKYMHSLKQHLKKRDHRPATPLNPDGTPNPDIVIDVVGNRRGPRQNKKQNRHNPYQQQQHHQQQIQQQQPMTVSSSQDDRGDGGGSSSGGHPSPYSMQQLLQLPPSSGVSAAVYPGSAESFMYSMITKRKELVDYQAEYLAIKNNNNNNNNNNSTAVDDKMDYHLHHNYHSSFQSAEDLVKVEYNNGNQTPEWSVSYEQPSVTSVSVAVIETGPLNLSKDSSVTPRAAGSSRRKGIACKLERPAIEPPTAAKVVAVVPAVQVSCSEPPKTDIPQPPVAVTSVAVTSVAVTSVAVTAAAAVTVPESSVKENNNNVQIVQQQQQQQHHQQQHHQPQSSSSPEKDDETHVCHHCDIIFKENIMYSMHMGFHSFRDPFACNLCGEITADKFSFFAHIARVPHS